MATTGQNFTMWAGDTKEITFTITDATNLVGASAKWGLSLHTAMNPLLISKSSTDATQIVIDSTGTTFTVYLLSSETADLSETVYYHEAEVEDVAGNLCTVSVGEITMQSDLVGG